MGILIDLTRKKFGRLTVIKRTFPNAKNRHAKWLCECECGTKKVILGGSLKSGSTRSCGCLYKESGKINNIKKRLNLGLANLRQVITRYKLNAKKRGLKFKLTEEQFYEITQKDCFYCGEKPSQIKKGKNYFGEYIYNGIDRIDNKKGYTIDNVVPCCKKCNIAKNNSTLQEYQDWIKKSYNRLR